VGYSNLGRFIYTPERKCITVDVLEVILEVANLKRFQNG
jgi:hypothetical protein